MTYCEDAPCCGCCTPTALGWHDEPDYDSFYDRDDYDNDPLDPSECDHTGGNYSYSQDVRDTTVNCDDCDTTGHRYYVMGEQREVFPDTKITGEFYEGGEDRHLDGSYES